MKNKHLVRWAFALALVISIMNACKKAFEEPIPVQTTATNGSIAADHRSFPLTIGGTPKQGNYRGRSITYQEIDGKAIWQGDILLSNADLSTSQISQSDENARVYGGGLANEFRHWPDGRIPYKIENGMDSIGIKNAMAAWEEKTPINFVPRTNEFDYILIRRSASGARSWVGRQGGVQIVEFPNGSSEFVDVALHELGHAIGLVHEHVRGDALQHIVFHQENLDPNINPGNWIDLSGRPGDIGFDGRTGFDFKSVMLYDSYDGARFENGNYVGPVLTRKVDGSTWGPTFPTMPSYGDEETVRAMYADIYIVRGNNLFGLTQTNGHIDDHLLRVSLGDGWKGAAKTFAEGLDGKHIYSVQGSSLWRTNRLTGSFQQWAYNSGNWSGAVGLTGADPQGNIYTQQGNYLWRIDKNGVRYQLGNGGWNGTKAVYYHKGWLYVLWKSVLYKVNTENGSYSSYLGDWTNATAITSANSQSDDLYMIVSDGLWRINSITGSSSFIKNGFKNTTAMTGYNGYLYIASDGYMYKVSGSGKVKFKEGGYENVTSMGVVRANPLLIFGSPDS